MLTVFYGQTINQAVTVAVQTLKAAAVRRKQDYIYVAAACGYAPSGFNKIWNGSRTPSIEVLVRWAALYNWSVQLEHRTGGGFKVRISDVY